MAARTDTPATKAIEWLVEQLSAASTTGWWADKLGALGTSKPAYTFTAASTPSTPTPAAADNGALDRALERAARAESAANALTDRVTHLESELQMLKRSHERLAAHLEEAVGPHEEGAHKQHWWSRLAHPST